MIALIGEWKCFECQNVDSVMAELGVNQEMRDRVEFEGSSLTIDFEESDLYIKQETSGQSYERTFALGKEQDELTLDGRIVRTVYSLESDCILKQVQQHGFTEMVITREVIDDVMTTSVRTGDSSATLKYRRIGPPKRRTETANLAGAVADTTVNIS
ncbi:Fatty acid-binding protein type VII [Paragonimus skrjabini miyazakii]|uniref:Fatty acid-binding protein type VII n=1 Tax=Paragonimus skrjabini miyazakii TaxID=59628 RepID=A0A8S9YCM2_9TREM|nr:Fatty acid-binding protein type VII [Paragonimus skrjabini miyazakii]